MRLFLATAAAAAATAGLASADVLVDQVIDGVNGSAAYNTNVGGNIFERRTADDFTINDPMWTDLTVSTFMAIQGSPPPEASLFKLDIWSGTSADGPDSIVASFEANAITFRNDIPLLLGQFPVYQVDYNLAGLDLSTGTYFVSSWMSNFAATQNVFFTTANTGNPNGSEMWVNFEDSTPGPVWFPATEHPDQLFSELHDTAFTIEGTVVPAPGALALLGVAGLAARRRRRA